jgi:hypothetical protein
MPMTGAATDKLFINDLLTRFFQAFDDKNWPMLRDCLSDEVLIDYSSFRGELPAMMSGEQYVQQHRSALHRLDMRHNFLNLHIELDAFTEAATARCNYILLRFHRSFDGMSERYLHSSGHYFFAFTKVSGTWRICRITQDLQRNYVKSAITSAKQTQDAIMSVGGPEPRRGLS